jgi:hypothetical protein
MKRALVFIALLIAAIALLTNLRVRFFRVSVFRMVSFASSR